MIGSAANHPEHCEPSHWHYRCNLTFPMTQHVKGFTILNRRFELACLGSVALFASACTAIETGPVEDVDESAKLTIEQSEELVDDLPESGPIISDTIILAEGVLTEVPSRGTECTPLTCPTESAPVCVIGRQFELLSKVGEGVWIHSYAVPLSGCESAKIFPNHREAKVNEILQTDKYKQYTGRSDQGRIILTDWRSVSGTNPEQDVAWSAVYIDDGEKSDAVGSLIIFEGKEVENVYSPPSGTSTVEVTLVVAANETNSTDFARSVVYPFTTNPSEPPVSLSNGYKVSLVSDVAASHVAQFLKVVDVVDDVILE